MITCCDYDVKVKVFVITTAVAVVAGAAAIFIGSLLLRPHHTCRPTQQTHAVAKPQVRRDTPSVVIYVGAYTPIASPPVHFITIEQSDNAGAHADVTLTIPARRAGRYQRGQQLNPQQTNELIDGR